MSFIHHRIKGKGDAVVFLHGFCETLEIWDGFADQLSSDFQVIVVDLPGFGKSHLPSGSFSIEDVAALISKQLDDLAISGYSLVGHSLGGYVSLALAQLHPDRCKSLTLFHSTALADTAERRENRNRVYDFVNTNGVNPFIDTFVPGLFYNKHHPSIQEVHRMASATKKETVLRYTHAMRDRQDRLSFLQGFQKPRLLLGGEFDGIIPATSLQEIAQTTGSTLAMLPETAHMGMLESPNLACKILGQFLKSGVTEA